MYINNRYHLTYCTNIHSERTWETLFESLKRNVLPVKKNISPYNQFGIGLRLSDFISKELLEEKNLIKFKSWLTENNLYVYTMNGFPYGMFHNKIVKDDVHKPDWTTKERVEYTKRLCRILVVLLPDNMEGGISTSPLSYKPWFEENPAKIKTVYRNICVNLAIVVEEMWKIRKDTGKIIHLDIEPEPDGMIENSGEVIEFYNEQLVPAAVEYLVKRLDLSPVVAEEAIRTHIRVCYDICHFAISYESHEAAIRNLENAGIRIGKVQISAALKANISGDENKRKQIFNEFEKLAESTYLHQVIEKDNNGKLTHYSDLPAALMNCRNPEIKEWRTHFHVPVFLKNYGRLESTQEDILEVLKIINEKNITDHLEVETYTWEVLPKEMKMDITTSIQRELEWVLEKLEVKKPVHG